MRLLILLLISLPAWGQYAKYFLHVPASGKVVSGPHTDKAVLIDVSSADLRTTGDGGLVTSTSGYDIVPHSDAACTTAITGHLRIAYSSNGSTGRWRGYVKVSSLSSSSNVYLCFANSSVTTDQTSASGTWTSDHIAVYGFGDGTTISLTDWTSNGLTLTNTGTVTASTDAKIYGAAGTNWSGSVYLERADGAELDSITAGITVCAWVKPANFSAYRVITAKINGDASVRHFEMDTQITTGKLRGLVTIGGVIKTAVSTNALSTSAYSHACYTYDGSNVQTYVNGVADGSPTAATGTMDTNNGIMTIGAFYTASGTDEWTGPIDDLQLIKAAKSAGWIETDFNIGTPSSFWDVTGPTAVGGSAVAGSVIVIQ